MKLSVTQQISQVDRNHWNNLSGNDNPFLSYEFLSGLELTRCVGSDTGWEPYHLVLHDQDNDRRNPVGAIPLYLKFHSWGEYVFDLSMGMHMMSK